MIRFSWLQFRLQAAVAAGVLAIIALALALTGPNLAHLYDTTVANCSAHGELLDGHRQLPLPLPPPPGPWQPRHCPTGHSSASSGARPWWPANWRPGPIAWYGRRASPAPAGWP